MDILQDESNIHMKTNSKYPKQGMKNTRKAITSES